MTTSSSFAPVLLIAKKPCHFFVFGSIALGMSISAHAQPAFNKQQKSITDPPQPHLQHQEMIEPTFPPVVHLVAELPAAPSVAVQASTTENQQSAARATGRPSAIEQTAQGTATVTGLVLDAQGNGVPGAKITLTSPGKLGSERTTTAAADGGFTFRELPAGKFRMVVTAAGFGTYTSPEFAVKSGETIQAPKIALNFTATSNVNVFATADQIAEAQLEGQEKQRVFGVFQNFYTSYIWEAEPMSPKQKYRLAYRTIIDPTTFVVLAGVASAEQYEPGGGARETALFRNRCECREFR